MSPKQTLFIVLTLVITGEAIAEFFAKYFKDIVAAGLVAFAILLICSIHFGNKHRRQGGRIR